MRDVTVRLANSTDKSSVLNLLNEGFKTQQKAVSTTRDDNFWNWKYRDSVFGNAVLHIIESEDEILASGTLWPFEFVYKGQVLKAFQPCDTIVVEKARGKGFFRKMNEARIAYSKEEGVDFIFNFPNQNSLPGYLKMGWRFVGKLQWYIKVLKPFLFLQSFYLKKQSKRIKVGSNYTFTIQKIKKALKSYDVSKDLVTINSSEKYYQYRYGSHPTREYGIIEYKNNEESSIAIFNMMQKGRLKEMVIMEVITSQKNFSALMGRVIKEAKTMGVGYIAMINQQRQNNKTLILKGFIPKKNKNIVYLPLNNTLDKSLLNINTWNLSASLHDSI